MELQVASLVTELKLKKKPWLGGPLITGLLKSLFRDLSGNHGSFATY